METNLQKLSREAPYSPFPAAQKIRFRSFSVLCNVAILNLDLVNPLVLDRLVDKSSNFNRLIGHWETMMGIFIF